MVCAVLSPLGLHTALAQDTTAVRADSVPIVDSVAAVDSLRAQDSTAVLSGSRGAVLPVLEAEVPPGPLPPGSRYSFTRDSILWAGGLTLADLLARIPGAYVLRAGFVG